MPETFLQDLRFGARALRRSSGIHQCGNHCIGALNRRQY